MNKKFKIELTNVGQPTVHGVVFAPDKASAADRLIIPPRYELTVCQEIDPAHAVLCDPGFEANFVRTTVSAEVQHTPAFHTLRTCPFFQTIPDRIAQPALRENLQLIEVAHAAEGALQELEDFIFQGTTSQPGFQNSDTFKRATTRGRRLQEALKSLKG